MTLETLRRAGRLLVTVWGAVTLVFFASRLVPTEPARIIAGPGADEATVAAVRAEYGLDAPLLVQYGDYLGDILRGDFGRSTMSGRPVGAELAARFAATVELVGAAVAVAVAIAVPAALRATRRPRGPVARTVSLVTFAGTAVPAFLVAVLLLYLFYTRLGIAPPPLGRLPREAGGFEPITGLYVLDGLLAGRPAVSAAAGARLVLPAVSLAASLLPQLLRVIRAQTDRALALPATRAARRAGVRGPRLWLVYVLSPAASPTVALIAASFGYLLGGAVVVEVMFSWNGIGSWAVQAVSNGDYNVVQAVVLVVAAAYAAAYLAADLIARLVDPRTRGVRHA
jgi:peptide/nickel transport system permease protein